MPATKGVGGFSQFQIYCDKIKIVTNLKNSNCDKTKKTDFDKTKKSNGDQTPKLKLG